LLCRSRACGRHAEDYSTEHDPPKQLWVRALRTSALAYARLGPQAMANYVIDHEGEYFVLGAREYLPIAVAPTAKGDVGSVPNLPTCGFVKPGAPMISGFVVNDYPRRVLIRVVGPGRRAIRRAGFSGGSGAENISRNGVLQRQRQLGRRDLWPAHSAALGCSGSVSVNRSVKGRSVRGGFPAWPLQATPRALINCRAL